jgi:peptide/nickel transport system permease protein
MLAYTARRLLVAVMVTVAVSVLAFMLLRISGDVAAAIAGESASSADIEKVRVMYGLDRPLVVQYLSWAEGALTGDFGMSFYFRTPVARVVRDHIAVTMILGGCGLGFALVLSIPLGVLAALRPNTWLDRLALTIAVFGQALPTFWFALMMIILFGVILRWLPITGSSTWKHFIMPSVALGYYATPAIMRLTRTGMLDVLASDYIRTARAKGLRTGTVLVKHALRNAVIPVVSLAAVQLGFMLGGSVIIESIFALHGLGLLAWESITRSDVSVVQAIVLILACFYIVLTLLADLLNAYLDPRIRAR